MTIYSSPVYHRCEGVETSQVLIKRRNRTVAGQKRACGKSASRELSFVHPKTLRLAGCERGSYTGGPANWRFWRLGRPLVLTFLGPKKELT